MGTLEEELQETHDAKIGVCITWLWDGGVDVRLVDEKGDWWTIRMSKRSRTFCLAWRSQLRSTSPKRITSAATRLGGKVQKEVQKIYDSEIDIEISWLGDGPITVKLGNEFYGFDAQVTVSKISGVLPWLAQAIHERYFMSKYDVERRGGEFTPEMAEIRYER